MGSATAYLAELEANPPLAVPGVDLGESTQVEWLGRLAAHHDGFDPPQERDPRWRYRAANHSFNLGDAMILQAMLRELRPNRVVEVGSGWSSAVMLDTAERHLGATPPKFTFVEPYPEALESVLRADDLGAVQIQAQPVQQVDPAVFESLVAGDVLFVDCSHVAKIGSDVLFLFLDVFPGLAPGVVVHVHDIFYPFEYPSGWVSEGRAWSEAYLLRAMLVGGANFEILFWNDWMASHRSAEVAAALPSVADYFEARHQVGSIWLRRL